MVIEDFNGDAKPDIVVSSRTTSEISALLGDPAGGGTGFGRPAGDFSTLVQNPDSTFTRTLKNGTKIEFDATGLQTAIVDRDNNTTS